MNIDFDALRDPDAPEPGARERAAVDARARRLRARSRINRLALSSVSIVAVVALAFGIVASQRDNGPHVIVEGPSGTAPSSIGHRFVPPTSVENGIVTLPVTLPDGETTTLTYPQDLRIAQLGFAGGVNVQWPVARGIHACCGRAAVVAYTTVRQVYGTEKPIRTYRGTNGDPVPLLAVPQGNVGPAVYERDLAFQIGPWLVRVDATSLTEQQRATWARSLTGSLDGSGYLVLHATAPLSVGNQFDGGFGEISGPAPFVRLTTHSTNRQGGVSCGAGQSDSTTHRRRTFPASLFNGYSWCIGRDLHVAVGGPARFVDPANRSLQVSALALPTESPSTPTTTTTFPIDKKPNPPAPPFAVSASFVSTDEGWALVQGSPCGDVCPFRLTHTADGGRSWSDLAEVGRLPIYSTRVRFADPRHGFVFDAEQDRAAPLLATTDGGAHWTQPKTPFTGTADLAIARGTVYVVSFESAPQPAFRIWSSPVGDTLHWSEDPLLVSPGAGPVPTAGFVFSGNRGWLVQNDRGTVNGARMAPDGTWSTWAPPCLDVQGEAQLAASSARDLVAVCAPGFATSSTTTYVEFSHDAGSTFQRHIAPGGRSGAAGPIMPNAHTAVIKVNVTLRRTTDNGATWDIVFNDVSIIGMRDTVTDVSIVDSGFTTSTQGFLVNDNGLMLMTHDAGATWQKVTLP